MIFLIHNHDHVFFHSGNCLELAANGILNHAKCKYFTWGCPDKPYFSDKIYNCKYNVLLFFIKPVKNCLLVS